MTAFIRFNQNGIFKMELWIISRTPDL